MSAIYKKELKAVFSNMTGYVFIAFILLVGGIFVTATNFKTGYPNFEYSLSSVSFTFLFVVPILTMRVLAEEKHSRTDQLLYSLPISVNSIVVGKYQAALTVFAIPVGVMAFYPLILSFYGTVSLASAYSGLVGFFFLGAALIAVGVFMSSLTESQVIAAVLSFGAMLIIYLMSSLASLVPAASSASYVAFAAVILLAGLLIYYMTKNYWAAIIAAAAGELILGIAYFADTAAFEGLFASAISTLSFWSRFDNFVYGIFDITSLIYYASVSAVFIFFSIQSVEKRRWS